MSRKGLIWPRYMLRSIEDEIQLLNHDLFGKTRNPNRFRYLIPTTTYVRQSMEELIFVGNPGRITFISCGMKLDQEYSYCSDYVVNNRVYNMERRFPDLTFEIKEIY